MKRIRAFFTSIREYFVYQNAWRHCPHSNLIGVYGDAIIFVTNGRRLICQDCGNTLDGPVSLAEKGKKGRF